MRFTNTSIGLPQLQMKSKNNSYKEDMKNEDEMLRQQTASFVIQKISQFFRDKI